MIGGAEASSARQVASPSGEICEQRLAFVEEVVDELATLVVEVGRFAEGLDPPGQVGDRRR